MNNKQPDCRVESVIIKTIADSTYRHFFRWMDAGQKKRIDLRIELIDKAGAVIGEKASFTIRPQAEHPSGPFFTVDASEVAFGFRYYTATLMGTSIGKMDIVSPRREDLREHNERVAEIQKSINPKKE